MPLAEKLGRMQPSPVDYNLDLKGLEGGHGLISVSVGAGVKVVGNQF